jgi:iron(III) transport system substrate-binding protein
VAMRILFLNKILGSFTLLQVALIVLPTLHVVAAGPIVFAQTLNPALVDAKKQAESKGFVFYTSRDEIIAKARQEGRLRALVQLEGSSSQITKAFNKKYPFINVHLEDSGGPEAHHRFIRELQVGAKTEWDVLNPAIEIYPDYLPHVKKIDILGMAERGVLQIPTKMIDPSSRNIVISAQAIGVVAYNKERISEERAPNTWDDFLKPELKGRKFLVDIRPHGLTPLAVGLGEEWLVKYAQGLRQQEPIWFRSQTTAITGIAAGEFTLHQLTNYHSCMRVRKKNPQKVLVCKVIEPIPVRPLIAQAVVNNAPHPNSALLFLEFLASPEAQRIMDENEPHRSSMYVPGSELEKIVRGKKVAVVDTENIHLVSKWMKMIVEAFGFPRADR